MGLRTVEEIRAAGAELGKAAPPVADMPEELRARLRRLLAPHVQRATEKRGSAA